MDLQHPDHLDSSWWRNTLPRVRAFVQRRLRPELAQVESPSDIVQSACRELLGDLDREASLHGNRGRVRWRFLRRAMRKIVQKHRYHAAQRRHRGRARGIGPGDPMTGSGAEPLSELVQRERAERLAAAMQQLPEHYQRVIEWVHFDRLPHAVVAERLGRSEDASKMLLFRAMARLSELLGEG